MRLIWTFVGLALLFLVPFLLWGEAFGKAFTAQGAISWLQGFGSWAWAAGIALLVADLALPIPGTAVIAALGYVYGSGVGGAIGAAGSFLSGALAFGICRALGRRGAVRLLGEEDLRKGERLFSHVGGWLVALSRWMPLLPEVIACLAGLTRTRARTFFAALACGCLPLGFTFATVGHAGIDHPVFAVVLSAVMPPILWFLIQRWIRANFSAKP